MAIKFSALATAVNGATIGGTTTAEKAALVAFLTALSTAQGNQYYIGALGKLLTADQGKELLPG
jgi:hypothetical protein